ncbi:MAG: aspartate--tRNA ligase [Oscillospiraceae bacterium]|nr:aspartate--tRNA ligase [Oscillospiraceae bacterium]
MRELKRTHYNTELSADNIGETVCVMGWVQKQRHKGALIFIDLRDRTGIIQLTLGDGSDRTVFETAKRLRSEFVIAATGIVKSRGENINEDRKTGAIEIDVGNIIVYGEAQTPPFEISEDETNVNEELRLKYRYLDLRRPSLNSNIIFRHHVQRVTRDYFYDNGFIDIETPNLIKPTPEGARDYLVPSRVHNGKFYVLPQSPQIYKQLLMVAGFDRYFQIARCYRDEDLRADRQPEFTQIDLEMSFADEDEIFEIMEGYMKTLFKKVLGIDIETPFLRMTYKDCMNKYGSDKPDLRFGYEFFDLTDTLEDCSFKVFSEAVRNGGIIKAVKIDGDFSRKEIDALTDYVKTYKAKGLAWYKNTDTPSSSYSKFLTDEENKKILDSLDVKANETVFIVSDSNPEVVYASLGALRCEIARRKNKIPKNLFKFLWVTDFPMFEYGEEEKRWFARHHPFTLPNMDEFDRYHDGDASKIRAKAYDLVLNGMETGGGSIRITKPEIQARVLKFLGYDEETAMERFGFLLESYKYGAPQHGGIAFGLDRLVTLLLGLTSIRDVIAFPKVQNASELMSGAPSFADGKALEELGIAVVKESK